MNLGDYRLIFAVVGLIGVLLFSAPSLALLVSVPGGERFSELYLLGSEGMAEGFPYEVVEDQEYSVIVGVGNHLGSLGYYAVRGKLLNQSDVLPNATSGLPSLAEPLFEYRFCIGDNETWQESLSFSLGEVEFLEDLAVVGVFIADDVDFDVHKPSVWDSNSTGFFYRLVFELWLYNDVSGFLEFNNRFVYLRLNVTGLEGD